MTSLTWGADGSSEISSYGTIYGKGGVIVDGRKPTRQSTLDGVGFGAGGGYDIQNYYSPTNAGYKGVAVLSLCE